MVAAVASLRPARNRAIIYVRQSNYREESISLANQEQIARDYCERHGYIVVSVEVDTTTGRRWDTRPGVVRTLAMIEDKQADVIVLWKWSRLSRRRLHWAIAADRVDVAGGRIESVTEPIDTTTASGRFQRGVMTELAAFQSEQIGDGWREVFDYRIRQGLPKTGGARFGYVRTADGGYEPDPRTGQVLRDMYDWYLSGVGHAAIATRLNDMGITSTGGSPWVRISVAAVMNSGFGAGLLVVGTKRPFAEREWVPGAQAPVITTETWEAYRTQRLYWGTRHVPQKSFYLFSGIIRCECGARMGGGRFGDVAAYRCCRGRDVGDPQPEHRMTIRARFVDAAVKDWLTDIAADVDKKADALKAGAQRRLRTINDAGAIDASITKIEKRMAVLTIRFAEDKIPEAAYRATVDALDADLQSLRARQRVVAPNPREEIALRALAPDLLTDWDTLHAEDPERLRQVVRPLIGGIKVSAPTRHGRFAYVGRVAVWGAWEHALKE